MCRRRDSGLRCEPPTPGCRVVTSTETNISELSLILHITLVFYISVLSRGLTGFILQFSQSLEPSYSEAGAGWSYLYCSPYRQISTAITEVETSWRRAGAQQSDTRLGSCSSNHVNIEGKRGDQSASQSVDTETILVLTPQTSDLRIV